jgi:hypothetical protein
MVGSLSSLASLLSTIGFLRAALVLLAFVAVPAQGQSQYSYELRIRSLEPGLENGGTVPISASTPPLRFVLEGRVRATQLVGANQNRGIGRFTSGPGGTPGVSNIAVLDPVFSSRLLRGQYREVGPGGFPLTGRGPKYRLGGPGDTVASLWHSKDQNGPDSTPWPLRTGNTPGALDFNRGLIYAIDATMTSVRPGDVDPWLTDFPIVPLGEFSAWSEVYYFDVEVSPVQSRRTITLQAAGQLSAAIEARLSDTLWLMNFASPAQSSFLQTPPFTFQAEVVPGPGITFEQLRTASWTDLAGTESIYRAVRASEPISWVQAAEYARSQGGHLATVNTGDEHLFIMSNLLRDQSDGQGEVEPWIGALRPLTTPPTSSYTWHSGEPFSFSLWGADEPSTNSSFEAAARYRREADLRWRWDALPVRTTRSRDLLIEIRPCQARVNLTPPFFVSPVLATAGQNVRLTLATQNATSFQWRRNGVPIPQATSTAYVIPFAPGLEGFYDCVVRDACGAVVSSSFPVQGCSPDLQPVNVGLEGLARFGVARSGSFGARIFGGEVSRTPRIVSQASYTLFSNGGLSLLTAPGPIPAARSEHAMSHMQASEALMFGGRDQAGTVLGDTWRQSSQGAWSVVTVDSEVGSIQQPPARAGAVMVFDEARSQVVMFGGVDGAGNALGDTWVFDAQGWREITSDFGLSPLGRWNHAMAYDQVRGGIVLFGGRGAAGLLQDTWRFDGQGWSLIASDGPSPREEMTLHAEPASLRMQVLGGRGGDGAVFNEQWELDAAGWRLVTSSTVTGPLFGHRVVQVSTNGAIVLTGGYTSAEPARWPSSRSFAGPTQTVITDRQPREILFVNGQSTVALRYDVLGSLLGGDTYRWRKDGVLLTSGITPHGSEISMISTILEIENPKPEDAGVYTLTIQGRCGEVVGPAITLAARCSLADIGGEGGAAGFDQQLDANDFVVFIHWFMAGDLRADFGRAGAAGGGDGALDNNDLVVFLQYFFGGCR